MTLHGIGLTAMIHLALPSGRQTMFYRITELLAGCLAQGDFSFLASNHMQQVEIMRCLYLTL